MLNGALLAGLKRTNSMVPS